MFHVYSVGSKHKLSTILIANVVNLPRFVSVTFLFKTFFKFFVYFNSLYILYMVGLSLWDTVSMNLAQ